MVLQLHTHTWGSLLSVFLLLLPPPGAPQRPGPACLARLSAVADGCDPGQQQCQYQLSLPPLTLSLPPPGPQGAPLQDQLRSLADRVRRLEEGRGGVQADQTRPEEARGTAPEEGRGEKGVPGTRAAGGRGPANDSPDQSTVQAMQVKLTKMSASLRIARSQISTLQGRLESLNVLNMDSVQAMVENRVENVQALVDRRVENLTGLVNKVTAGCQTQCALQHPIQIIMAPRDCSEYSALEQKNGVYRVTPDPRNGTFEVFCDMESYGGGWTVIQSRLNGSVSFNRTWSQYKQGFGKLMGEFWLGNDHIHLLAKAKDMVLRVELEDVDGVREYAKYDHFYVANEFLRYKLSVGGYSGTAGDALVFDRHFNHDQQFFSTPDRDHDNYPSGSCAAYYGAGWWFDSCMAANLNGQYHQRPYKGVRNGIFWGTWHNASSEAYPTNYRQAFRTARMMIRPRNYAP